MTQHQIKNPLNHHLSFLKKRRSAFTLVELVVVITILAILGTIGFLSVGGYSSRARDSERVADVANVAKSLDLSIVAVGSYPTPDNSFSVTYSGAVAWYQGTIGAGVVQQLHTSISGGGLSKKPVDPLDGTEFNYSTLAQGKAYQIAVDFEGDAGVAIEDSLVSRAYAAPGAPTISMVRGNYGGSILKVSTGSTLSGATYILAVPSIISNTGSVGGTLKIDTNQLSGKLLYNGKSLSGASTFNPNTVIFSGASLPSTATELASMMSALQSAYTGTDIASNASVSSILAIPATNYSAYATTLVNAQLGGAITNPGSVTSCTVGLPINGICSCPTGATCSTNGMSYLTPGTYTFTLSSPVTVSAVAVGGGGGGGYNWATPGGAGGGLGWGNGIVLTGGVTYTVVVGTPGQGNTTSQTYGQNSSFTAGTQSIIGYGAGQGGTGSDSTGPQYGGGYAANNIPGTSGGGAGGNSTSTYHAGGAGGYTGRGGSSTNQAGAGGGGGSPSSYSSTYGMSAGGGVGLYGQGANGLAGNATSNSAPTYSYGGGGGSTANGTGTDGYAGECWGLSTGRGGNNLIQGGFPGGGGGGGGTSWGGGPGGGGAVRIIWGAGRSFPNNAS